MPSDLEIPSHLVPELDPEFVPASLWTRAFEELCQEHGSRTVRIVLQQPSGKNTEHEELLLPAGEQWEDLNFRHLERIVKALIWSTGGHRFLIAGAPELCTKLQEAYSDSGVRAFDADYSQRFFGEPLTFVSVDQDELPDAEKPNPEVHASTVAPGCRIGFDLGGSDRKCAAVIDGEVVFSEEVTWDPYFEKDPSYHLAGIRDSLRLAAEHLPRVDAIGGSAAGVYVDNKVRAASLFRGIPDELFKDQVENMFLDLAHEWGDIPFVVANDGDVTALAGAMSLNDGAVLGIAMGTSTAAGYVNESRNLTQRISELAFLPLDYREDAPIDEWSGDRGCNVQYFSQQAVARLIPASGLPIDQELGFPEQLLAVQEFMAAGDDRAAAIYRTIGTYLGYAIPHYARFYIVRHLLLLGRVLSGQGGEIIIAEARKVLAADFPELANTVKISTPDEKLKRHGQAIAAASLPTLPTPTPEK